MSYINKSILIFLLIAVTGCASNKVVTNTTSFYIPSFKAAGTIAVLATDENVKESLEFLHYKSLIEKQLNANGFEIKSTPQQAKYIAYVSYGIDTGKSAVITTPVIGQTSGGYRYNSGTVIGTDGPKTYSFTSYSMPTYGVVSSTTSTQTYFTRAIALDIVESESIQPDRKIVKTYEGRAKSTGSCSQIAAVFETMLQAIFEDFPGQNGKVRVIKVDTETRC